MVTYMATESLLDVLKMYELLPVPSMEVLRKNWTMETLQGFLNSYLKFQLANAKKLQASLSASDPPLWIYIDPLDAGNPSVLVQHILLAERIVTIDPIAVLHCPAREFRQWLQSLHGALKYVERNRELIKHEFLVLVPDPRHYGLGNYLEERVKVILADKDAREMWYSNGHLCVGALPTIVTNGANHVEAPCYHFHFGHHFALEAKFADPGIIGSNEPPHLHFDFRGSAQTFKKLSVKRGIIYHGLEREVQQFFAQPILEYQASLAMSRVWAHDRLSTFNPLTAEVLRRDVAREAKNVVAGSQWIMPAQVALKRMGVEALSPIHALEFREQYQAAFRRNIRLMQELCGSVQAVPSDKCFGKEIEHLISTKFDPTFKELDAELRAAEGVTKTRTISLFTLVGSALVLGANAGWSAGLAAALGALPTVEAEISDRWKRHVVSQRNPMYFLWKARRHGFVPRGD